MKTGSKTFSTRSMNFISRYSTNPRCETINTITDFAESILWHQLKDYFCYIPKTCGGIRKEIPHQLTSIPPPPTPLHPYLSNNHRRINKYFSILLFTASPLYTITIQRESEREREYEWGGEWGVCRYLCNVGRGERGRLHCHKVAQLGRNTHSHVFGGSKSGGQYFRPSFRKGGGYLSCYNNQLPHLHCCHRLP